MRRAPTVAEGDAVGIAGQSGEAEWPTPYVHLGIRVSSAADGYVDPATLLPPRAVAPPPPPAAEAPVVAPSPGSGRGAGQRAPRRRRRPRRVQEPPRARPWVRERLRRCCRGPLLPHLETRPRRRAQQPRRRRRLRPSRVGRVPAEHGRARPTPGQRQQRPRDSGRSSVSAPVGRGGHADREPVPASRTAVQSAGSARLGVAGATATATAGSIGRYRHPVGVRTCRVLGCRAARPRAQTRRSARAVAKAAVSERRAGSVRPATEQAAASERLGGLGREARGSVDGLPASGAWHDGSRRMLAWIAAALVLLAGSIGGATWLLARLRRINGNGALLRHHTDLLRELDPAHRACVHDDCGGHPGPPPASAWRRNVLPDRGRRARREGGTRRSGAGLVAAGVRRPDRGRLA